MGNVGLSHESYLRGILDRGQGFNGGAAMALRPKRKAHIAVGRIRVFAHVQN